MGTPEFAVPPLLALLERASSFGGQVIGVATQPDRPAGRKRKPMPSPVKQAAQAHDLPVYQPERLRKAPSAIAELAQSAPDLIVVAAYGLILPPEVLEIPRYGCVNIHASLLPAYRGASPITAALLDGLDETGISIMLMDEGMDTGPVLQQATLPINSHDTTGTLTPKLAQLGADLLIETLVAYLQGNIRPIPQSDLPGTPTHCERINKADGRIDWHRPAIEIERMVRAYSPWPSAFTLWQGEPFKILRAQAVSTLDQAEQPEPGTVARVEAGKLEASDALSVPAGAGDKQIAIGTGQGILLLHQVQPAGKRGMDVTSFLNGAPDFIGTSLP